MSRAVRLDELRHATDLPARTVLVLAGRDPPDGPNQGRQHRALVRDLSLPFPPTLPGTKPPAWDAVALMAYRTALAYMRPEDRTEGDQWLLAHLNGQAWANIVAARAQWTTQHTRRIIDGTGVVKHRKRKARKIT